MSIKYAKPSQEGLRQKENEMNEDKYIELLEQYTHNIFLEFNKNNPLGIAYKDIHKFRKEILRRMK